MITPDKAIPFPLSTIFMRRVINPRVGFQYFPSFQNYQNTGHLMMSRPYLTGVTTAEPRRYLKNYKRGLKYLTYTFANSNFR